MMLFVSSVAAAGCGGISLSRTCRSVGANNSVVVGHNSRRVFGFSLLAAKSETGPFRGCVSIVCAASEESEEEDVSFDEIAARVAEVKEVIQGLEDFKERIITDATKLAKKVRTPPKKLKEALDNHPDILKVDEALKQLEVELKQLQTPSS